MTSEGHSRNVCDPLWAQGNSCGQPSFKIILFLPHCMLRQTVKAKAEPSDTYGVPMQTVGTLCWGRKRDTGFSKQLSVKRWEAPMGKRPKKHLGRQQYFPNKSHVYKPGSHQSKSTRINTQSGFCSRYSLYSKNRFVTDFNFSNATSG